MLKMTGVKWEKISDIDKYLFIEKGLGGGISYISKRYEKTNNKYMNDYDSKKPTKFITYLDMNNLHRWGLSEYLPYGRFKWLKSLDGFDVMSVSEKRSNRIFSRSWPWKSWWITWITNNDYPLAPEKLAVSSDMLLKYCKKIADKYEIKVGDVKKLIPKLGNKTNYVVNYRNLQLYLSLGMKLTKIHRVLKFKQSDWMKKYIDFNTEKKNECC